MRLLFLLNNDKYAAKAFALLLPEISQHHLKIFLSQNLAKKSRLPKEIQELAAHEKYNSNWLEKFSIPAQFCDDINSPETISEIKKFAPDLIISIRFEKILRQEAIDCARFGVLNLHSGILPAYRGVMASFWKILNGENELGATLHYIQDHTIDTGDIISITRKKFQYDLSLSQNVENLYDDACLLLLDAIKKIERGEKIPVTKQKDLGGARYFTYPKSEDVEKFLLKMKII